MMKNYTNKGYGSGVDPDDWHSTAKAIPDFTSLIISLAKDSGIDVSHAS